MGNCSVALEGNVELYNCPYDRSVEGTTMRINGSYSQVKISFFILVIGTQKSIQGSAKSIDFLREKNPISI